MHISRANKRRFVVLLVAAMAVGALAFASNAFASHFRGADISWVKNGTNTADFTFRASFRRSAYSGTAPDGFPAVGDVFTEGTGDTSFSDGEGGNTGTLNFRTDAINVADDYLVATALEPGNDSDPLITHGYGSTGPFTAFTDSSATIASLNNNPGGFYRAETVVNFADSQSPKTSVPPVVEVGNSGNQTFLIPAIDSGGQTLSFRLATAAESCDGCSDPNPPGLTVNPTTGQVNWDTTGVTQGLWFVSVVIEGKNGSTIVSSTQATFLIRVRPGGANNPPQFDTPPTPACGSTFQVAPGGSLSIPLQASDPDTAQTVTINNTGLPTNATYTPGPGTNPATGTFAFNPDASQNGADFFVTFTAQDDFNPPSSSGPCTYTIQVRQQGPQAPDITIDDVSVIEGPAGSTIPATFTLHRSGDTTGTSTVTLDTADGSATVADNDYVARSGVLVTFGAGESTKTVDVTVNGDDNPEFDEDFFANLTAPTNATVSDAQGKATITTDAICPPGANDPSYCTEQSLTLLLKKGVASVPVTCPSGAGGTCSGTVVLRTTKKVNLTARKGAKRVVLGKARYKGIKAGHTKLVRVKLGKKAARFVKKHKKCRVDAITKGDNRARSVVGNARLGTYTLKFKRR